jgi:IMP dehydrogenase
MKRKVKSFDDWLLVPQYSDIKSRKEIDISSNLSSKIELNIPIISSPMSTVTEATMCNSIRKLGGLGIIHRYNSINFQTKLLSYVNEEKYKSAAIGVTGDYKERLTSLVEAGLEIVCIDIAHGDHVLMKDCIRHVRENFKNLYIIAGNVSTGEGFKRISEWGANAVRVSVGSGSICTTRIQTGHGIPTIEAVFECKNFKDKYGLDSKIIADGGIKNSGDIVKSLAAGADFVMLGSMLSGTKETPGKLMYSEEGKKYKSYNGMASKIAQKNWKGSYSSVEGVSSTVPYKGTLSKVINEISSNIRSGLSYSGCRSIQELQENALFVEQTSFSHVESKPHIYNRK